MVVCSFGEGEYLHRFRPSERTSKRRGHNGKGSTGVRAFNVGVFKSMYYLVKIGKLKSLTLKEIRAFAKGRSVTWNPKKKTFESK